MRTARRSLLIVGLFAIVAAGGGGYYLWKGRLPFVTPPLAPTHTLKGKSDISFDQLAFYPDGNRLVAGKGAEKLVVWDLANHNEIYAREDKISEGGREIQKRRKQAHRERHYLAARLGMICPANQSTLMSSLPALLVSTDVLHGARKDTAESFGLGYGTDAGVFTVAESTSGPLILGITSANSSWDARYEVFERFDREKFKPLKHDRHAYYFNLLTHWVKLDNTDWRVASSQADKSHGEITSWSHYHYQICESDGAITGRCFSPDGRYLLVSNLLGDFWLFESGTEFDTLGAKCRTLPFKHPDGKVIPLAVLLDGKHALMHDESRTAGVWDLETGKEIRRFHGLRARPECFVLSRDGRRLASPDPNETNPIAIWDVETGKQVRKLSGHEAPAIRTQSADVLAFSPDGARLLSAGADKTLRLWDVEKGREVEQLAYPPNDVTAVALSAEGKVAVASKNEIYLWTLPR